MATLQDVGHTYDRRAPPQQEIGKSAGRGSFRGAQQGNYYEIGLARGGGKTAAELLRARGR